jgi:hypothetical protein
MAEVAQLSHHCERDIDLMALGDTHHYRRQKKEGDVCDRAKTGGLQGRLPLGSMAFSAVARMRRSSRNRASSEREGR